MQTNIYIISTVKLLHKTGAQIEHALAHNTISIEIGSSSLWHVAMAWIAMKNIIITVIFVAMLFCTAQISVTFSV